MKLDARRVTAFLRDPGAVRLVVLHGEDEGLVRQRADTLTRAVVGAKDDPFRVAWLAREDHARLGVEGERDRDVGGARGSCGVRDAGDGLAAAAMAAVQGAGRQPDRDGGERAAAGALEAAGAGGGARAGARRSRVIRRKGGR